MNDAPQMARAVRTFRYEALTREGTVTRGTASGSSELAVRATLRVRGLLLSRLTPVSRFAAETTGRIGAADLAVTLRVLATLLGSGLSAGRAVQVAYPLVPDRVRSALPLIESALREGAPLSSAIASGMPGIPIATLGILQAGEAGGDLGFAFEESARVAEESLALRQAILGALAYPAILATASVLVVGVLTLVVIPRFAVILEDLGQALPTATRVLLAVADMARVVLFPATAIAVAAALLAGRALRDAKTRARWHAWLLGLPVLGPLRHSLASSRATAFLSSALATGLPAPRSLRLAAAASSDNAVRQRLEQARELVLQGRTVSDALRTTGALSEVSLRLIGAGEASGSLVATLRHASALEGTAARMKVQSMLRLIEPTLIVSFGGLVAFVAVALLQAVYSVRPGG